MAFNPIPLFKRVVPEGVVDALNKLVNDINANFQAIGFGYSGAVTLRQFKLALAQSSLNEQVISGIPASADSPIYIAWTSATNVVPNDVLAQNVQTTLGYSAAQMSALFALAETLVP
jgi:hypothetical protein